MPARIRNAETLTALGLCCLGFSYDSGDGVVEAKVTKPYPELYTIPSGHALIVVQAKRKVLALIWGGKLRVERRGIVG